MSKKHGSLGMSITEERIVKGLNGITGGIEIIDHEDDNGNPLGTEVRIQLPVELN